MIIGPQVAFVDDIPAQIKPLESSIENIHAGSIFFNASPDIDNYPKEPIEGIQLLFLDLHYGTIGFDPYRSAEWVNRIIPKNTKYTLIIWSKDTHEKDSLLAVLAELDIYPTHFDAWQKTDYNLERDNFDSKIKELIKSISGKKKNTDILFGQIIDIEEDGYLINCLLDLQEPTFQIRKFDIELFENLNDLQVENFVKISISTEPGIRKIEVFKEINDLSEKFLTIDYFEGLKDTAFFIEDTD